MKISNGNILCRCNTLPSVGQLNSAVKTGELKSSSGTPCTWGGAGWGSVPVQGGKTEGS